MNIQLEELQKGVQCKIGRNVLLFQEIEKMLKEFLSNVRYSGYVSEIKNNREKEASELRNHTMGQLKDKFINTINPVLKKSIEPPIDLKEPWFSFEFNLECSSDYEEERRNFLTLIVNERNELIHHLH